MWRIDNPSRIFSYLYRYDDMASFQLICLIKAEKYMTMPDEDRLAVESSDNSNVTVGDVIIKNPNNPVQLMGGKIMVFKI